MEKRKNEIIENAQNFLLNSNLSDEEAKPIVDLINAYKRNTYDKWEERHEMYRNIVDDMVNDCGFQYKELAEKMANNHPTLQQSFMRMCANFIQRMAEKTYCDDRNRTSVEYARAIMDNVGEEHFPFI
jgi:uncharacterized membrane-anchored protein YjiN (DUF445 family)